MWSCTVHDGIAPESETAALRGISSLIADQSGLIWAHQSMNCMRLILLKGMGLATAKKLMCTPGARCRAAWLKKFKTQESCHD